jgi:hypothetical protein
VIVSSAQTEGQSPYQGHTNGFDAIELITEQSLISSQVVTPIRTVPLLFKAKP